MDEYDKLSRKYNLIKKIGRGSFGIIYIAQSKETHENVIIKIQKLMEGSDSEIKTLEYISHNSSSKYTVKMIESGIEKINNSEYLLIVFAFDFMNSMEIINSNALKLSIKKKIVNNTIKGLKSLHSNDIAHVDIKPANIIIDTINGDIKYIDFGMSCVKKCTVSECSGTVFYMSKERGNCSNEKILDLDKAKKGDLYALGITIYEFIYNDTSGKIKYNKEYEYFNKIIQKLIS
jgi:serine/threonine protein kinase